MLDLQVGLPERIQVLLISKESDLVVLREMLDPVGRSDQVVEVDDAPPALHAGHVQASDLEVRLVHEVGPRPPGLEGIGREPRFDDQHAVRCKVPGHARYRPVEVFDGPCVSDRAEQADHGVEMRSQDRGESCHPVDRDVR